jgi:hypothetical protein
LSEIQIKALNRKDRKRTQGRKEPEPDESGFGQRMGVDFHRWGIPGGLPSIGNREEKSGKSAAAKKETRNALAGLHKTGCTRLWTACTRLIFKQIESFIFH